VDVNLKTCDSEVTTRINTSNGHIDHVDIIEDIMKYASRFDFEVQMIDIVQLHQQQKILALRYNYKQIVV
jgi:hypothetical protein